MQKRARHGRDAERIAGPRDRVSTSLARYPCFIIVRHRSSLLSSSVYGRCTVIISHPRRGHGIGREPKSNNKRIYVRFRRSREFRAIAEEKEEGKNERGRAASKKGASGTLSPTSRCRARASASARAHASARALRLSRDKGRLIQGPTDVHAHTHQPFVYRAAHSSTARRIDETRGRDRVSSMSVLTQVRTVEPETRQFSSYIYVYIYT